mmetsp:Transcript_14443/g.31350  ORF Transcript_14443/g.31350 Transcript_14443/m.31350 type:complete len:80 (+) Transcript_14443:1604-1843(+)
MRQSLTSAPPLSPSPATQVIVERPFWTRETIRALQDRLISRFGCKGTVVTSTWLEDSLQAKRVVDEFPYMTVDETAAED